MKLFSILSCKISSYLLSFLGRGSSLPGMIALKLDKNILEKLVLPDKVIVVTGSSGKGSTTKVITHVLRESGYKVSHNTAGGNQMTGIVTTLLKDSSLGGKVKSDVVVLEMDERSIKYILPTIKPSDVVITNITRDQPPRQMHTDFIFDEISRGLNKDIHLYLNSNDPILAKYNLNNDFKVTYYGIDKLDTSYKENIFNSINAPRCPKCHNNLEYKYYHFEDLGDFKCSKCDFGSFKPKYKINNFDKDKKEITVDKKYKISLNNDMLYNFYNTLAAYSVLIDFGLDKENVCSSISNLNKDKKIFNKYKYKDRDVFVLNNKCENSTTYNQSLLYVSNNEGLKTLVIGWQEISRRYLWDDLSWLYDIEFELFNKENVDKIIACGPQRYDIAVRLKYAGISEDKIKIYDNLYYAKEEIANSKGSIYAILNFDYVNDFNNVMEGLE